MSVVGCTTALDEPADGTVEDAAALCQAAVDHLAACEGSDPAPEVQGCDVAQARTILDTDCDALGAGLGDAKADFAGYRRWACSIGIYRYCPEPACDPEADEVGFEPVAAVEGSACLQEALAYQGCGACGYYMCREETAQCGEGGYLRRFAEKYCLRFRLVSEPEASPAARRWLRDVRRCLVETLDRVAPGDDCGVLEREGFDSHPGCYVSTGFCSLEVQDWLLVLGTIDPTDADYRQMLVAGTGCLEEWLGLD